MNTTDGIIALKQHIEEEDWSWTFSALRRDAIIWETLSNHEFREGAIKEISKHGKDWSPARLALLVLSQKGLPIPLEFDTSSALPTLEELCETPLKTLNSQLRIAALQAYDEIRELEEAPQILISDPITNLGYAGLLALALRERYRLTGTWNGITSELPQISNFPWETTLGCLFGIVPDKHSLLKTLPIDDALHAVFANPLKPTQEIDLLDRLVKTYPEKDLPGLLNLICNYHANIISPLIERITGIQTSSELENEDSENRLEALPRDDRYPHTQIQLILNDLQSMFTRFGVHHQSMQLDQALPLLGSSLESSHKLVHELTYYYATKTAERGETEAAKRLWNQYLKFDQQPSIERTSMMALSFLAKGHNKEARSILSETQSASQELETPIQHLVQAKLALEDRKWENASDSAQRCYRALLEANYEGFQQIKSLVSILNTLNLHEETIQAAQYALKVNPNDAELLSILANSQMSEGKLEDSTQNAHLAIAIAPQRIQHYRDLAEIYEKANDWQAALEVRDKIVNWTVTKPEEQPGEGDQDLQMVDELNTPTQEDYRLYAKCALKAQLPEKAIEICTIALDIDPEDGLTHALIGEAHQSLGNSDDAHEHFKQATELSPHMAEPWLALAKAESQEGGIEEAIETLQTAIQSAPENPEIFLALGKAYSSGNSPTEALTAFRRSAELFAQRESEPRDALSAEINLNLGRALFDLGHYDESLQILETAYKNHPEHPGLSYAYARTLLELDEPEKAITPLSTTMRANEQEPGPYLDFAGALLRIGKDAHQAIDAIEHVLEIEPDNSIALGMLAEALSANGDLKPAVTAYRQALETDLKEDPHWSPRLSLGLGLTALQLGLSDLAIATIQQGLQTDPEHIDLAHALVEAYQAAELNEEALQAAKTALDIANEDIDNLIWFSEKAVQFKIPQEAVKTLERSKELAPHRVDLLLRIGEINAQMGHFDEAKEVLYEVITKENASVPDLQLNASFLLEMKDYPKAIDSLQRAIEITKKENKNDVNLLSALWRELAVIHRQANDSEDEIHALDKAISYDPDNTEIYAHKADLLIGLRRSQAALECLEKAIQFPPDHPRLHYRIAHVYRDMGDLSKAMSHAEQALNLVDEQFQTAEITAFHGYAAEIAHASIQDSKTRIFLDLEDRNPGENDNQDGETFVRGHEPENSIYQSMLERDQLGYHCLRVELFLEDGEDILAADALTSAIKLNPDHPRVMALQSRLSVRHGDLETANTFLQTAMEKLGVDLEEPVAECENIQDLISLSDAMAEQLHWNGAVYLLGKVINIPKREPRTLNKYAQAMVMRAEAQRLCQKLQVIEHAPGQSALAGDSYKSFEEVISLLKSEIEKTIQQNNASPKEFESVLEKIDILNTQGKAVFVASEQHCQALRDLGPNPVIQTQYIATLMQSNDLETAINVAKEHLDSDDMKFQSYPPFLAQASTALAKKYPETAVRAIRDAVRIVTRNSSPDQALYHALMADILSTTNDYSAALDGMEKAVSLWDDEPRWHALIAELYRSRPKLGQQADIQAAIKHFEKAAHLEPEYAFHHIALGEAYLEEKNLYAANEAFERAKQLASDQPTVWLALAKAYWTARDEDRAILYAHRAADLSPNFVAPRLLLAKIALHTGNPNRARQEAESALQLDPEDTKGHVILAQALLALDHPLQALNVIETAIQIAPNDVEVALERITLLQRVHGAEFALEELENILESYPSDDRVLTKQAEIMVECGQTDEALQIAREALNLLSSNGILPERIARVHNLLGTLQRRMGQLDQAVHHLNEAIDIYPEWTDPYLELGQTYQDRRQHDQALLSYRQAIEVSPRDPRPYYRSGLILKDTKDYLQAEAMLRRAAELAPNDLNIHRQLGAMVALNIVHNRNQDTQVDHSG